MILKKSNFTNIFINKNHLNKYGFRRWIFYSGMMFGSLDKWWGDYGNRNKSHEGVDLCLYEDNFGKIRHVCKKGENVKVPAMYDGTVVHIIDDFLGKSIIIEHAPGKENHDKFYTIYGHTKPKAAIKGMSLKQGDNVGTIADSGKLGIGLFSHLHLSVGWPLKSFDYNRFNWDIISNPSLFSLIDPLDVLDCKYSKEPIDDLFGIFEMLKI